LLAKAGTQRARSGAALSATPAIDALVLAGSRGEGDPLAAVQGVRHRALLEVAGVPMLLRVLRSLQASPSVTGLRVSIDDPGALDSVPELKTMLHAGQLAAHRSLSSPSRSVLDALAGLGDAAVLVTTADHALLTPEMAEHFLARAAALDADVCVGLVAHHVVEARFPAVPRTWIPFRDDRYSGANLYVFRTRQALRAVEFWIRAESFRKKPWRIASTFGPLSLLLFALRRLTLDAALTRASKVIGCRIEAVRLPFAEAAVDVDRPSDLELAESVLNQRVATRA
jgi:GTP:adenosylcobinamide-phosphate guanylyltransferase